MSSGTSALVFQQLDAAPFSRTIDAKLKENYVSVTDYGAVGDGVTDDSTAIADAIEHINSVGGILYFPRGTFLDSGTHVFTGPLNAGDGLYGHIGIVGEGATSVWRYTGTSVFLQVGGGSGITSISQANPSVVTTPTAHGFVTGENVTFVNTAATPDVDGSQVATVTSATTFTIPVNVTVAAGAGGGVKTQRISASVQFQDIVIESTGAVGSKIGVELICESGYQIHFENVWIDSFSIGIRADDANGCSVKNSTVIRCTTGVALGRACNAWHFYNAYVNECTLTGIDIGYYDVRWGTQAPPNRDVVLEGCALHTNLLPIVIGGNGTTGVSMISCYVEDNTKGIQLGHPTAEYSGLQLESADISSVEINGALVNQNANNPVVINRSSNVRISIANMAIGNLGAGVAAIKSISAATDVAPLFIQGVRSPCYENSAAVQTARTGRMFADVVSARKNANTAQDAFLELDRTTTSRYSLVRFYNSGATASWDFGQYADDDLSFLSAESGNKIVFISKSTGILTAAVGLNVSTAGSGLRVKEGSNAKQGVSTLIAGTIVVANTSVTANSRIFLTVQSLGTVAVATPIAVTARTPGTSFTITSAGVTDTSVVAWEIFEPA